MTMPGEHTFQEILSQPAAWQNALQEAERMQSPLRALFEKQAPLVFTGCGSTYYLALSAAAMFRKLIGRLSLAFPAGELWLNRNEALGNWSAASRPLLIAISRSGATTETLRAVHEHRAAGGKTLAVTNYPDAPLAALADAALVIPAGQEKSVAQTRSFASMFVGLNALAALLGDHRFLWADMQRLPELGENLLRQYQPLAQSLGEDLTLERFYFLGSGLRYGLACEASLKMKEMSLSHSEPFHFLEFRHGPKSMVNQTTLIFGLFSIRNRLAEQSVVDEMRALGAKTLTLGEAKSDVSFLFMPEEGQGALFLPVLQLLAYYRALAKGLDPDHPHNLTAVVTIPAG